jgi:hypothetical protein
MQGANKERWKVLCEQAAVEKDPVKLHELIREINDLLEQKQNRLNPQSPVPSSDSQTPSCGNTRPPGNSVYYLMKCAL